MLLDTICDDVIWKKEWVDNSAKDAPPPDFRNDTRKIMLEVMRVDDHAFESNGRIINPTNQKAREIEKELREKGVFSLNPNLDLLVNVPTGLSSEEDHNYRFYVQNFTRIVDKHKKKIPLYKSNNPGYKLVFFIFDESSMYVKTDRIGVKAKKGEFFSGYLHYWYNDKTFIDVVKNSGIDSLIWFTPYTYIETIPTAPLPQACVFDCNNMDEDLEDYPEEYMVSSEE